jgi:hypothetical protein
MVPKKCKLIDVVSQFHKSKPTKSTKKVLGDYLSWDEVFEDAYLADLEMASDVDLKNGIQVETRLRLAIDALRQ